MPTKNNIQWLDSLRSFATIGVIIIHVSSPLVNMSYGKNMDFWWIGNVVDSITRYSVPLFLMLSGATLLNKEYGIIEFYRKRVSRVLVPFLFWMLAYWVFRWAMLSFKQQPRSFEAILQWGIELFLKEGISKHLWYIYMILFIYLYVPFLGKILRKLSNSHILLMLLGWVIFSFICKSMSINQYGWSNGFGDKLLGYFLHTGYLVFGFYLSNLNFKPNNVKVYSVITFFLCAITTAILTYISSQNAHKLDLSYYGYFTPIAILQCSAIFLCVKDITVRNKFVLWLQNTISNYSYGIYLVHIMVIGIFFRYGIFWTMTHPLISLPLVSILTLITSCGIIFVLRKIPFGKYVAG
ncbi:MAG: acyltransferase [Paludibacter sp.]